MQNPGGHIGKLLKGFQVSERHVGPLTGNWQQQTPQMDWRKPGCLQGVCDMTGLAGTLCPVTLT